MKTTDRTRRTRQAKNTKGFYVKSHIRAGAEPPKRGFNDRDSYGAEYGTF